MLTDDGYHDAVLGLLKGDWTAGAWRGRWAMPGDACDLVLVEAPGEDWAAAPRFSGLVRLGTAARMLAQTLLPRGIGAICQARQARLNWRDGPPPADWQAVELLVDADDSLWLSLHEGATDEYSLWIVAFDAGNHVREVRRAPYVATPDPMPRRGTRV